MSRIKTLKKEVHKILEKIDDNDKRASAAAHLHGVSLAAVMIAKKRGLDAEYARALLKRLDITTEDETDLICSAIWHHDSKADTDTPFDELLKDADVIDHSLSDPTKEVKPHERERYGRLCEEFGLE